MSAFETLRIANTALGAHQVWLDALAGNIANANTVRSTDQEAFRATYVVFDPRADGGVDVAGFAQSNAEGRMVSSPDHPLADADGYVRMPDLDMSSQMSQLVMAQRGYQASVQVTKSAQDTYTAALQIGSR
ncbi:MULTISPECIES: flagellar basal body rod protein FlgC [Pimelobacter]|uniref:flagellar basal body rod protein FlgC n=1 Tax=Pimelobacter TaxID=2044 RepID=UPI001C051ABA|nr:MULTISPECIES: flagellar basal body rod C-terminal domain-containing protein [Pimelobacter]MBU2694766.1 flagellar basal-body rod protein FlgC [Pimelobacter sp. 30-1]UUW91948.1 flagellar basal body protein [Pimelobacter simplex]UUW95775.1 flagellar basal body protein [Pimelobacter simplex]